MLKMNFLHFFLSSLISTAASYGLPRVQQAQISPPQQQYPPSYGSNVIGTSTDLNGAAAAIRNANLIDFCTHIVQTGWGGISPSYSPSPRPAVTAATGSLPSVVTVTKTATPMVTVTSTAGTAVEIFTVTQQSTVTETVVTTVTGPPGPPGVQYQTRKPRFDGYSYSNNQNLNSNLDTNNGAINYSINGYPVPTPLYPYDALTIAEGCIAVVGAGGKPPTLSEAPSAYPTICPTNSTSVPPICTVTRTATAYPTNTAPCYTSISSPTGVVVIPYPPSLSTPTFLTTYTPTTVSPTPSSTLVSPIYTTVTVTATGGRPIGAGISKTTVTVPPTTSIAAGTTVLIVASTTITSTVTVTATPSTVTRTITTSPIAVVTATATATATASTTK